MAFVLPFCVADPIYAQSVAEMRGPRDSAIEGVYECLFRQGKVWAAGDGVIPFAAAAYLAETADLMKNPQAPISEIQNTCEQGAVTEIENWANELKKHPEYYLSEFGSPDYLRFGHFLGEKFGTRTALWAMETTRNNGSSPVLARCRWLGIDVMAGAVVGGEAEARLARCFSMSGMVWTQWVAAGDVLFFGLGVAAKVLESNLAYYPAEYVYGPLKTAHLSDFNGCVALGPGYVFHDGSAAYGVSGGLCAGLGIFMRLQEAAAIRRFGAPKYSAKTVRRFLD